MATTPWAIPAGKEITGATFIKDTDNNIFDTMADLVEWTNSTGAHAGTGLSEDMVDVSTAQTIAGVKTFSDNIVASGGITSTTATFTGSVSGDTGVFTGQVKGITPVAVDDFTRKDYVDGEVSAIYEVLTDSTNVAFKFSSGLLVIHSDGFAALTTSTAQGNLFRSTSVSASYRVPFVGDYSIATGATSTSGYAWTIVTSKSQTAFTIGMLGTSATDAGVPSFVAVGRWK